MLETSELAATAATFGVADQQIRRDHLISHVLAAMSHVEAPVIFFGGTALARTHLTSPDQGGRLSEDIDLCGRDRRSVAQLLDERIPQLLRREFPRIRWQPGLSMVNSIASAQLVTESGLRLKIQLLDLDGHHRDWRAWPTETRNIHVRYSDVAQTTLRVPTLASFAGMKLAAWLDRRAARDLYDLAALARIGAVTHEALATLKIITGRPLFREDFERKFVGDWEVQLAHQTAYVPSADDCLQEVRNVLAEILDWSPPYDFLNH